MARIDYQTLLDNALKSVVKDALIHAQFNGCVPAAWSERQ